MSADNKPAHPMPEHLKTTPRYVCTKDAPWSPAKSTRAQHPDAIDRGMCNEGCCDLFECPNCHTAFRVEAAQ